MLTFCSKTQKSYDVLKIYILLQVLLLLEQPLKWCTSIYIKAGPLWLNLKAPYKGNLLQGYQLSTKNIKKTLLNPKTFAIVMVHTFLVANCNGSASQHFVGMRLYIKLKLSKHIYINVHFAMTMCLPSHFLNTSRHTLTLGKIVICLPKFFPK